MFSAILGIGATVHFPLQWDSEGLAEVTEVIAEDEEVGQCHKKARASGEAGGWDTTRPPGDQTQSASHCICRSRIPSVPQFPLQENRNTTSTNTLECHKGCIR